MCEFIEAHNLVPGYGCCACRTYNGLQRKHCKACGVAPCAFVVPTDVERCTGCGFGFWAADLAGRVFGRTVTIAEAGCPVCTAPLVAPCPALVS